MAKATGKASTVVYSPHIHSPFSVERIMWDVVIALLPAGIASFYFFGFNSLRIIGISVLTALISELLMNLFTKNRVTVLDGSAVITGILFAYNLPPMTPWYVVAIGSFFAIVVVKWAFGGLGQNFMNPALGGRIFVLAAWPGILINHWSPTIPSFIASNPVVTPDIQAVNSVVTNRGVISNVQTFITNFTTNAMTFQQASEKIITPDAVSTASPLNTLKTGGDAAWNAVSQMDLSGYLNLFIGNRAGCIGEVSILALLIGGAYLIVRKVITWQIPVIYIGTVAVLAWAFGGLPFGKGFFAGNPLFHVLSGGLVLGAVFMATDMVTSPITTLGKVIFAVMLGALTVIIRLWGGYPEGVSYAIVFMNIFVPLIDRFTRERVYGHGGANKKKAEGGAK